MPLYMLDTNAASAAMRGTAGLDARLARLDPSSWCISAITHAEIRYGVALKPDATRLARYVDAFFEAAQTLPWDEAAADRHGELRAALRRRATPIGDFDEMIAAHALSLDAVLVTDNVRHFKVVKGLAVENWIRNN
jgi:tRNA(fMet)-specific endonuclease VapC